MPLPASAITAIARDYTAAWNPGDPDAVAAFFAEVGQIVINRGEPWLGRSRVSDMAAGFHADVPDPSLTCDDIRFSGSHALGVWNFTGQGAGTSHPLKIHGWEEWEVAEDGKVKASRGWFDAEEYARQAAGG